MDGRGRPAGTSETWSFALVFAFAAALPGTSASPCVGCHPEEGTAEETGVHGPRGVTCVDCHGGDPDATTIDEAHSATQGYRGIITRKQNPEVCGSCHSRPGPMREAGLRWDSLALYRMSAHGKAVLEEGKTEAATCIDCHDPVHGTRKVLGEASPLRPGTVQEVCARCHGDDALMDSFHRERDIPEKYVASVHGRAYLEGGDPRSPACTTCHPGHALVPEGVPHPQEFCATCHAQEAEHLAAGPHGAALTDEGDVMSCVHCHRAHDIDEARPALLGEFCSKCHKEGSRGIRTAVSLRAAIEQARGHLHLMEAMARRGEGDLQTALDEGRTLTWSLGPLQHSQDVASVEEKVARVARILEGAEEEARAAANRRRDRVRARRRWIPVIWGVVLLNVLLLYLARRSSAGGERRRPSEGSRAG